MAGATPSEPAARPCSFCGPVFGSPLQVASPAPTLCLRLAHKPLWVCCPDSTPWELPNTGVSTGHVWQEESLQSECGDATPLGNPSQAGMPAGRGGSRLVERQRLDQRAWEGAPRIARRPVGVGLPARQPQLLSPEGRSAALEGIGSQFLLDTKVMSVMFEPQPQTKQGFGARVRSGPSVRLGHAASDPRPPEPGLLSLCCSEFPAA